MASSDSTRELAVLIGAGSTIGIEIARTLLHDRRVWIAGPPAELERTRALVTAAEVREVDVTSAESCDALLSDAARNGATAVVNLACFSEPAPMKTRDLPRARASWKKTLDVGLLGAMHVISAAGAVLPPGASIVSISSINARMAIPAYAAYCAAKAGLDMVTQVAAAELAPIRVNAIAPGPVEATSAQLEAFPAFLDGLRARHLAARRLTRSSDIARVVRFLLSEDAAWITGQTLTVDGGVSVNHGELPSPKDLARALEGT